MSLDTAATPTVAAAASDDITALPVDTEAALDRIAAEPEPRPSVTSRWPAAIQETYGTPTLTLVRGEGAMVWDDTGRPYVDLLAGIAVNALGHAHPAVVDAVSRQVATLGHVSNLYAHPRVVELAERLLGLFGRPDGRVFFCNSGAEANEAALKLTRRTGRHRIVAAEGGFHGRTTGALAITGQPAKRAPFEPLLSDGVFVPFGDTDALGAAVDDTTAAVFLEPIQGENGVVPAPPGYLAAARAITREHGALLVLDEVQTGIGRTGSWFAHQPTGVRPDVVTLAKGLGGGLPIGACVAFGEAATMLTAGQHGSTFGGNPVACAAALAVLDTIESEDLLDRVTTLGDHLSWAVDALDHPLVDHVRGRGLMRAIVLTAPVAGGVEAGLRDAGFLVNAVGPAVIRLTPPLVITDEQVAAFLAVLPAVLERALPSGPPT